MTLKEKINSVMKEINLFSHPLLDVDMNSQTFEIWFVMF